ncbi:MAG TPA: hypothetical protein VK922_16550 [Gemmatimonadaceae bacterium]|nr:hypothetical protein [Gemmatimonadaceae bacterium]
MKRTMIAVLIAGGAVACAERSDFTGPGVSPPPAVTASTTSIASGASLDAVQDAFERIAPALGESASARDAAIALRLLHQQRSERDPKAARGTSRALESALAQVERDEPELAPELDAIRLAIAQ